MMSLPSSSHVLELLLLKKRLKTSFLTARAAASCHPCKRPTKPSPPTQTLREALAHGGTGQGCDRGGDWGKFGNRYKGSKVGYNMPGWENGVIAVTIMTRIIKMVVSTKVEKMAMMVVMRCKMVNSQYCEMMGKVGFQKSKVAVVVMEEEQDGRRTYN
ncbi:hypothetical protein GOP47_0024342 [Adiantum capillus-veneris]|uniref:Uncharacterized protein n=1 Tax=Adiantum capillus-veneris TaxID=13818 RepID=A0A9D4U2G1_ADICA|nr:hypothetical protein GOP47_0024342 [Adiantum capillus-veneris]